MREMNKLEQVTKTASGLPITCRWLGRRDYLEVQEQMQRFTAARTETTPDQIWLVEHPAVYTQGTACEQQPLMPSAIPLVHSDRGGQITFHGPGQVVMYPLLQLRRFDLGVKALVERLEETVIVLLREYGIAGERKSGAPGVYVDGAKIAALGLRIRRGASYHGLSFNVKMDLTPFSNIDPCGFVGLRVTQLEELLSVDCPSWQTVSERLVNGFCAAL